MKSRRLSVIVAILLIGALIISQSSCGKAENKLIGKWKCEKRTTTVVPASIEIFDNKTFKSESAGWQAGKWDLLKDGRIQFTTLMGTIVMGSIKNDKLQIVFGDKGESIANYDKAK